MTKSEINSLKSGMVLALFWTFYWFGAIAGVVIALWGACEHRYWAIPIGVVGIIAAFLCLNLGFVLSTRYETKQK